VLAYQPHRKADVSAAKRQSPVTVSGTWFCGLVLIFALTGAWYFFAIAKGTTFWQVHDDYSHLSLAHAINLQQWINHGTHRPNVGLVGHPGIPFYVVSWLALKAALPVGVDEIQQILQNVSTNPEPFWLAIRTAALILNIIGVIMVMNCPGNADTSARLAAAVVFFAVSIEPWDVAITKLGIESFALPYAALFYIVGYSALHNKAKAQFWWLAFGVVAGIGYTLKLHYIVFAVAGLVGLASASALGTYTWRLTVWLACLYIAGFLILVAPTLLLFDHLEGTERLIQFHKTIILHTGAYGSGDPGVLSIDRAEFALNSLIEMRWFVVAAALMVCGYIFLLRTAWRDLKWRKTELPFGIVIMTALILALGAVIKHFGSRYVIVPIAILPIALLYLSGQAGTVTGKIGLVAALIALPFTLLGFYQQQFASRAFAEAVARDVENIKLKPLEAGEFRLWEYYIPSREFALGIIARWSEDVQVDKWYETTALTDRSTFSAPTPWRYAVLEKSRFPTHQAVSRWTQYEPSDRIEFLETTVLLERVPVYPSSGRDRIR